MIKKRQKFIYAGTCLFVFLFIGFFYMPTDKALAGLEVSYPTIPGVNPLTASSKLPDFVLYLFSAGMFVGFFAVFLSLIIAGATYFLSPASAELRANAKDRVAGAISGLLILALTYLIVTTINPQLSILTMNSMPVTPPPPPATTKAPGVYFYPKSGCSDNSVQPSTSSVPDLGPLKNKVNSVGIVKDSTGQTAYISILYDNTNFWGKCQYLDPNKDCQSVSPFAASASVYQYDFNPQDNNSSDGGVYFYRKSCFNDKPYSDPKDIIAHCNQSSGGYYFFKNSDIQNSKGKGFELNQLKFTNVPPAEQDCTKYDKDGNCTSRTPPSLGGENTSSVIINGNYLVLLIYYGPQDTSTGQWTSCQEFPTIDDVNKLGPRQIKWENIRNSNKNVIPNYAIIIPIHGSQAATPATSSAQTF